MLSSKQGCSSARCRYACLPFFLFPTPPPRLQTCDGTGTEVSLRPLGRGIVQQLQQCCSGCGGSGSACPPSERCASCGGHGLVEEKRVFEVCGVGCGKGGGDS